MGQVINNIEYISGFMGKVCMKHIIILFWKMVQNMFFLDSEHAAMGKCSPPQKKSCMFVHVRCLVPKNYFTRLYFFVAAVIMYVAKVYI